MKKLDKSIVISGMPAVGKTTLANKLATKYNLKHIGGGDILKQLADEKGFSMKELDWWDKNEAKKFIELRNNDSSLDKLVDEKLVNILSNEIVIITSYTIPWLYNDCISIYLSGSSLNRAKRLVERDNIILEEALKIIERRDLDNQSLYKKIYNFDFVNDLAVFDFIFNTDKISKLDLHNIVFNIIDSTR